MILTLGAGLANLLYRLAHWLFVWFRGSKLDATSLTAGIFFYRRLVQMLASYDLRRSPAETQSEFARRAHKFLSGQGIETQPVADVPQEVVDAFYRVRFGHLELEPESLEAARRPARCTRKESEKPVTGRGRARKNDLMARCAAGSDLDIVHRHAAGPQIDITQGKRDGCVSVSSDSQALARAPFFNS